MTTLPDNETPGTAQPGASAPQPGAPAQLPAPLPPHVPTRAHGGGPPFNAQRFGMILSAVRAGATIEQAAKEARIPKRTLYDHLRRKPALRVAMDDAMTASVLALESEARRRAMTGVLEPVYQKGQQVGTIRRYSDTLLALLLKARDGRFKESAIVAVQTTVQTSDVMLAGLKDKLDGISKNRDAIAARFNQHLNLTN